MHHPRRPARGRGGNRSCSRPQRRPKRACAYRNAGPLGGSRPAACSAFEAASHRPRDAVMATVAGVDGCRAGWVCVTRQVEPPFQERAFLARDFQEIWPTPMRPPSSRSTSRSAFQSASLVRAANATGLRAKFLGDALLASRAASPARTFRNGLPPCLRGCVRRIRSAPSNLQADVSSASKGFVPWVQTQFYQ